MYEIFQILLRRDGITVADVSRATGIGESTFSNWKKRRNYISGENAILLSDYFGVSVDYLMTGKSTEKKSIEGKTYYFDNETAEIAQELMEKPHLRSLLDAERNISPEAANALITLINAQTKQEEGRHG